LRARLFIREKTMQAGRSADDDAGFSIVESLIALGLVFGVMVGLLATVNIGVRGVVTGRQRSVAVAIANEVMEAARNRSYADVGHDLDSDPTLAGDAALQGTVPNLFFTDLSPGPNEPLVGSVVDAGAEAATHTNALFPFSPHRWTTQREATTYTTSVYITRVVPTSGDPYRRLTVIVTWDRSLHGAAAVPASVRLSSFLFDAIQPPDPLFVGLAEAHAGTVTVTGTLAGIDLSHAGLWFPYAHGEIDSRFVRRVTGFAGTTRSIIDVNSGTATGCTSNDFGRTAECSGAKVETGSDNDAATAHPDHNTVGPTPDTGGNLAAGDSLFLSSGGGTAKSLSTARCVACAAGADDRLPYQWGRATGPASLSMPFSTGPATGSLLTTGAECLNCSTVVLDREDVSGVSSLVATATVSHAAIDLVTFVGAPEGYSGMVRIGSTNVTTSATSGPGAPAPTATGDPVSVGIYDAAVSGYRTLPIQPGTPAEDISDTVMAVSGTSVTMRTTVRSGPAVTLSTGTAARTEAQASLSNWLTVEVHLVVKETPESLESLADLVITLDYGRVTSRATYEPAPT
jgi:type II secretory pathway pseudopilin PulG